MIMEEAKKQLTVDDRDGNADIPRSSDAAKVQVLLDRSTVSRLRQHTCADACLSGQSHPAVQDR